MDTKRLAILLALADYPMPPQEIAGKVIGDSVGAVSLAPSSLYRLLHHLESRGYIKPAAPHQSNATYDLTLQGWRVLEQELPTAQRYVQLLQIRLSPRQYRGQGITEAQ